MGNTYTELTEDIKKLIELGIEYTNSNRFDIEELDTLKINIPKSKQSVFYRAFEGNKLSFDKPWTIERGNKPNTILSKYTMAELINIWKGLIVYEIFIGRGRCSVPATLFVYFEIAVLDYDKAKEVEEWAYTFDYDNRLFPPMEHVSFQQYIYKYSSQEKLVEKMKVKLQVAGYIKF